MQHQPSSHFHPGSPELPASSPPRAASSASSAFHYITGRHESYSDEDIELVHEIVTRGESLYPTLPERERLPTNALFLAAEEILPRYGYDPEDTPSHIARLIFKIGGQRSGDTLSDKFKAVLGRLGIQLEFVPSSPSARPESRASFALSSTHTSDLDPNFHPTFHQAFHPRREGSSDPGGASVTGDHTPTRARSPALSRSRSRSQSRSPIGAGHVPLQPGAGSAVVVEVELEVLESKLQNLRMREDRDLVENVFGIWRATACQTKRENDELRSTAAEFDNDDLLGEVLDIWNEEAAAAEQLRLDAEDAVQYEAYVAKMERRATRVYEIFTIGNVLAQWHTQAQEEIDRTAVARRHLVRKRTFEGWHAQHVEDETKVKNFILGNVLQTWSQVALHHEVRHEVGAQWHQQQLCKQTLHTMWDECKERLADEFYAVGLARQCLDTWGDKAHNIQDEYQVAVALDERLVLDEAVNIWLEEVDVQQYHAYECTRQWLVLGCRRDLEYWQEQARLSALLRQHAAAEEQDTKRQALATWHNVFQGAKRNTAVADVFLLKEPVDHWEREMKLKLFIERDEYETKAMVLEHWALEEKLVWYKGHLETRTKRQTFDTLFTAARQSQDERVRYEQEADYVDSYYMQTEVIDTWLAETDEMWKHQQNADLVDLYRTARPSIDHWREQCHQSQARVGYYRRKADKHRARSIVCGALNKWPAVAETTRRERMMTSLRQFRRQYKVELAQDCLGQWLNVTVDALDARHDARQTNLHYKREDLNDCLDLWNRTAKRTRNIQQIAADAELEVYCEKWQAQLHDAKENMQDAVEYDAEQIRKRCWEKWEFQTLQNESKRHMAATLQEKNERRVRRRILDEWQQTAVPEAAARMNPRMNSLSARRSVRQQLARSSVGGFYTASQLATLRPRDSPTRSLGPMPEFDEESLIPDPEDPGFMSTPTRRTGSARPLAFRPTSTPSAILASPYERELRRQYGPKVAFADINEESAEDLYT
ncbi:Sfi1 spindle body protein-domain-containing protein [Chaetomidium leptoderma]|uniref:Sfi1 spindle body protein-domain-containing protein n=1 Tax=Chaetomidium leptoderma TaxID=669021 RepID=A0AAN6VS39_9PEZI|nr:Sfi1 spindle body protein-domain-containing protein [Chaetomidium leptoderma]